MLSIFREGLVGVDKHLPKMASLVTSMTLSIIFRSNARLAIDVLLIKTKTELKNN